MVLNKNIRIISLFTLILILFTLSSQIVFADKEIKLLAVEENNPDAKGSIALLSLKTINGDGNTYLDTFPLTQLDTQISLRFAKDVACDYTNINCKNKDFLYKLRADSSIVGGPSAGAAGVILTIAELENLEIDPNSSITGTINSGNFIGPVGGIRGKIKAASENGITRVLIPKYGNFEENINNSNSSLGGIVEFGRTIGVEVIEVETIEDALPKITNYVPKENNNQISISNGYSDKMKEVADEMCKRTEELILEVKDKLRGLNYSQIEKEVSNSTKSAKDAMEESKFYSASSFCFNTNIRLRQLSYTNLTEEEFFQTLGALKSLELKEVNYNSPNNLQVYLIVKSRLEEMRNMLDEAERSYNGGDKENAFRLIAYSRERAFSISAWTKLFTESKDELKYDLKTSCLARVNEANERLQYARLFVPDLLSGTYSLLREAKEDSDKGNYPDCISKSIEVKVQSNTILTSIGLSREELPNLVKKKLEFAEKEIASQEYFPILAYSYYEYAQSLNENDHGSALLYAEYSLEMANLDSYLSLEEEINGNVVGEVNSLVNSNADEIRLLIIGILIGLIIGTAFSLRRMHKKSTRKKTK